MGMSQSPLRARGFCQGNSVLSGLPVSVCTVILLHPHIGCAFLSAYASLTHWIPAFEQLKAWVTVGLFTIILKPELCTFEQLHPFHGAHSSCLGFVLSKQHDLNGIKWTFLTLFLFVFHFYCLFFCFIILCTVFFPLPIMVSCLWASAVAEEKWHGNLLSK